MRRVVLDGNGTRKISFMPADKICSAHVYHVQQNAEARGCLVLHLTFVEGWPKNPAKYWRLREAGLWLADDDRYYTGKFLALNFSGASGRRAPRVGVRPQARCVVSTLGDAWQRGRQRPRTAEQRCAPRATRNSIASNLCAANDDILGLVKVKAVDAKVLFVPGVEFMPSNHRKPVGQSPVCPFVRASFSTATEADMEEAVRRLAAVVREARAEAEAADAAAACCVSSREEAERRERGGFDV